MTPWESQSQRGRHRGGARYPDVSHTPLNSPYLGEPGSSGTTHLRTRLFFTTYDVIPRPPVGRIAETRGEEGEVEETRTQAEQVVHRRSRVRVGRARGG